MTEERNASKDEEPEDDANESAELNGNVSEWKLVCRWACQSLA